MEYESSYGEAAEEVVNPQSEDAAEAEGEKNPEGAERAGQVPVQGHLFKRFITGTDHLSDGTSNCSGRTVMILPRTVRFSGSRIP